MSEELEQRVRTLEIQAAQMKLAFEAHGVVEAPDRGGEVRGYAVLGTVFGLVTAIELRQRLA